MPKYEAMSNRPRNLNTKSSRFDVNRNGSLSQEEIRDAKEIVILELQEEKAETQRKMGWTALASLIGFTAVLFSPILSDSRVSALSGAIDMFYISMAGIVGAVVGVTTWMTTSRMQTYSGYSSYEDHYRDPEPPVGKYGNTI